MVRLFSLTNELVPCGSGAGVSFRLEISMGYGGTALVDVTEGRRMVNTEKNDSFVEPGLSWIIELEVDLDLNLITGIHLGALQSF